MDILDGSGLWVTTSGAVASGAMFTRRRKFHRNWTAMFLLVARWLNG